MTDSTAHVPNDLQRVKVVCIKCGATAEIWITSEEISSMEFTYSELDVAYLHVCGKCLYQRIDSDAPIKPQRSHDPERRQHSKRTSGGYHRRGWGAEVAG